MAKDTKYDRGRWKPFDGCDCSPELHVIDWCRTPQSRERFVSARRGEAKTCALYDERFAAACFEFVTLVDDRRRYHERVMSRPTTPCDMEEEVSGTGTKEN